MAASRTANDTLEKDLKIESTARNILVPRPPSCKLNSTWSGRPAGILEADLNGDENKCCGSPRTPSQSGIPAGFAPMKKWCCLSFCPFLFLLSVVPSPAQSPAGWKEEVFGEGGAWVGNRKLMAQDSPATPGPAPAGAAESVPPPDLPPATPEPQTNASGLKSRTCRVNGLLVAVLPGGKTAGATSQMNVSALPAPSRAEASLGFNQEIGPEMTKALAEVRKFQTIRQGLWPGGYQLEVSFADKYTPKDGPSAAVACALLLEGLFTGQTWDPGFSVTGDLNADGSVQPVGGVPAKIRGAAGRQCRIVAIPAANERAVRDFLLSEGPHALMGIHVFALKEFDEARDLALTVKPAGLTQALTDFDKVVAARIPKQRAAAWTKLPAVAAQLRKVVKAAPHHLSARLLLEYSEGRSPGTLSLAGSLEAMDLESGDLIAAIREASANRNLGGLKKDSLGDTVFRLRRLRPILHPETRRLLDSIESFSTLVRNIMANPPRSAPFAQKAYDSITVAGALVQSENQKLRANPEVVAELMKE